MPISILVRPVFELLPLDGTIRHRHIVPHAQGGWVGLNGPEIGLVGEQGPEYIIPHGQAMASRGSGFTIQGVSERDIVDMVDRGLYFKLNRASPSAASSR